MGTAATPTATHFAGIDVSKDTLDAGLLGPDGRHTPAGSRSPTTAAGHAALLAWADRHARGRGRPLLHGGHRPVLCGPRRAPARRRPARQRGQPGPGQGPHEACGQANKTDPADARPSPLRRRPQAPALGAALARRSASSRPWSAGGTTSGGWPRREDPARCPGPDPGRPPVARPDREVPLEGGRPGAGRGRRTDRGAPGLAADLALLESITGVGRQTATTVLAELPPVDLLPSAESAAAYCGLAPSEFTSGKSVRKRTRLSKAGNARLRTALYLPTLTAIRFNPVLKRFYDRLVAAGKPKMQAVGACMRKLVMICYGVLKNRKPFDPNSSGVRPAAGGSPAIPWPPDEPRGSGVDNMPSGSPLHSTTARTPFLASTDSHRRTNMPSHQDADTPF